MLCDDLEMEEACVGRATASHAWQLQEATLNSRLGVLAGSWACSSACKPHDSGQLLWLRQTRSSGVEQEPVLVTMCETTQPLLAACVRGRNTMSIHQLLLADLQIPTAARSFIVWNVSSLWLHPLPKWDFPQELLTQIMHQRADEHTLCCCKHPYNGTTSGLPTAHSSPQAAGDSTEAHVLCQVDTWLLMCVWV